MKIRMTIKQLLEKQATLVNGCSYRVCVLAGIFEVIEVGEKYIQTTVDAVIAEKTLQLKEKLRRGIRQTTDDVYSYLSILVFARLCEESDASEAGNSDENSGSETTGN